MTGAWPIGPFAHRGEVLGPDPDAAFECPVLGTKVAWAAKDVFNPAAVVRDGAVHLLVRAEDDRGDVAGTSRIGLATSCDGVHFEIDPEPVLHPDDDPWQAWEWPGGCEDPRVVERPDGTYVCLYTAFDGKVARLFVATSPDLRRWAKHGPAFAGTPHALAWSKSASVVTEVVGDRLVAKQVDGLFWMYWGEGACFAATSTDLVAWQPVEFTPDTSRYLTRAAGRWRIGRADPAPSLRPVAFPRRGGFDSMLVEPGPPAVATDHGIVLIFNGANHPTRGDASVPAGAYQPGQMLFAAGDPLALLARSTEPTIRTGAGDDGQVGNVCFAEGLVRHDGRWLLYTGLGDSRIGLATAPT